jgi:alpha-beta hydrolase superfamily lysophospholipase
MQAYELKTSDGISLHAQKWDDVVDSERTLLIVHGLGEHQNRYAHVAEHFVKDGFQVYSYDQRGHGKSDGPRGHTPSLSQNLDDLQLVIESIPHKNLYLYGHSFGGNVTANYMLRRDCDTLRAAILSGAWFKLYKTPSKFEVTMATLMNVIYPKFTQGNQLNPNDLSYIEQVGIDYVNDPLRHNKITVGLFKNFHASGLWAIENACQLKIPTLVIHGADDHIIDAHGSREFTDAAGEFATLRIYDKTKHELHNDNKAQEVLSDISDWFKNI